MDEGASDEPADGKSAEARGVQGLADATPRPHTLRIAPIPKPPSHITKVPGVNFQTMDAGFTNHGPLGRWKKRAGRLVAVMWNSKTQAEFKPFLKEAEAWLEDACMQLAMSAGGVCGPIEANALATAAWQTAYARYWMHMATENPSDTRLFETASRVADAARANSLAAYDIAVRLARSKPSQSSDPLAAFIDVASSPPLKPLAPAKAPKTPTDGFADDE